MDDRTVLRQVGAVRSDREIWRNNELWLQPFLTGLQH
jgi:hypothetical protein